MIFSEEEPMGPNKASYMSSHSIMIYIIGTDKRT